MADPFIIGTVIKLGEKILERVFPDPADRAKAELELLKLAREEDSEKLQAELRLALGQVEVNKIEAASAGIYKGGWRPAVGWICVAGLAYTYVVQPLLAWFSAAQGIDVPPTLDLGDLFVLLLGMLGLGGMRSFERVRGKA